MKKILIGMIFMVATVAFAADKDFVLKTISFDVKNSTKALAGLKGSREILGVSLPRCYIQVADGIGTEPISLAEKKWSVLIFPAHKDNVFEKYQLTENGENLFQYYHAKNLVKDLVLNELCIQY